MTLPIILASSSKYRKQLIEKLNISVQSASPNIDETPLPHENPKELCERLATSKAQAVAEHFKNHLIIGSDQVASLDGNVLGKPGSHQAATEQLRRASGRAMYFYTAIALLNSHTNHLQVATCHYEVKFRALNNRQIDYYLKQEAPYDCAGSFKSEGLGITLFEYIRGDDPNSLIGLPLIELTRMLLNQGIDLLQPPS